MYVREYLSFIVGLYKADPCRIDDMIQKTGLKNELQEIKNVEEVDEIGTNEFKIASDACHDLRKQLFEFAVAKKFTVLQMSLEENKLEDIFHKLTN